MPGALHSPAYDYFRVLLMEARKDTGLTQMELSARLNHSQSFVSKYESGERRLDVVEFIKVCDALQISPDSIINQLKKEMQHLAVLEAGHDG